MPEMTCNQCGASLSSADGALEHMQTVHPTTSRSASGDYLCPGCPAAFHQLLQLQRHVATVHGI